MKRILTIFLLFVFLLNVVGFYGLLVGIGYSSSLRARHAMDENKYPLSHARIFKIPLSVAYYSNSSGEYRRVDGEFEHDGQTYRMVKQKLVNDTLYVVCVRDLKEQNINNAIADLVKSFSDKPVSSKQQLKSLSFIKDYFSTSTAIEAGQSGWVASTTYGNTMDHYGHETRARIYSPPEGNPIL